MPSFTIRKVKPAEIDAVLALVKAEWDETRIALWRILFSTRTNAHLHLIPPLIGCVGGLIAPFVSRFFGRGTGGPASSSISFFQRDFHCKSAAIATVATSLFWYSIPRLFILRVTKMVIRDTHNLLKADHPDVHCFVAVDKQSNNVVATATLMARKHSALHAKTDNEGVFDVVKLYVQPSHRGKGILGELAKACMDQARGDPIRVKRVFVVTSDMANHSAVVHTFHKKHGLELEVLPQTRLFGIPGLPVSFNVYSMKC